MVVAINPFAFLKLRREDPTIYQNKNLNMTTSEMIHNSTPGEEEEEALDPRIQVSYYFVIG